jgi:hypothetical protein
MPDSGIHMILGTNHTVRQNSFKGNIFYAESVKFLFKKPFESQRILMAENEFPDRTETEFNPGCRHFVAPS